MSISTVVTARIDPDLASDLDRLARRLGRSRAAIIGRAIERYVIDELAFLSFVQQGIDDVDAGRVRTQEEVEAMFDVRPEQRNAA